MSSPSVTPDDRSRSTANAPCCSSKSGWPKWAIGLFLAGHVWATCQALPWSAVRDCPVLALGDYGVHAHRAHLYRESVRTSGSAWGCDPAVCGGATLHPTQDIGSVIYEWAAMLVPWAEAGQLLNAMAWLTMLVVPLIVVGTGKLLDSAAEEIAWGLLIASGLLWFAPLQRLMLEAGMLAFLLASYFCLFVLAVYDRFLRQPTILGYAGLTLAGSLLFLVHPFGPVAIVPGLAWLVLKTPVVSGRWRIAALGTPLAIALVNAFWLVPFLSGLRSPPPPWAAGLAIEHPYWNWRDWGALYAWLGSWEMGAHLALLPVVGLGLLHVARRRSSTTAVALGLTILTCLLLFLFGSFWFPTRLLQPLRFIAVFWNAAALLAGGAIVGVIRCLRWPAYVSGVAYAVAAGAFAAAILLFGPRLANGPDANALIDFIQRRTVEGERLLLEAAPPYRWWGEALPTVMGREIVSTTFPDLRDPVQFLPDRLFGCTAQELSAEQTHELLGRWGIHWIFVRTEPWREFFRKFTAGPGEAVGPYEAFHVGGERSRFLVGSGDVIASINRLELRNVLAPDDYVVIRYRFHPGWICDAPSEIEPFPTPDKSGGLLRIRHPLPTTVLRFDPKRALQTPWPAVVAPP